MTEDNLAPYKTIRQLSQENARLKINLIYILFLGKI